MVLLTSVAVWIEHHQGTAAWVQAAGAIIGLIVAIIVPAKMARRADLLTYKRFMGSVSAISNEVLKCLDDAATSCNIGATEGLHFIRGVTQFNRFGIVSSAINRLPLHQLPGYSSTQSVLELQAIIAEGQMQLSAASQEIDIHGQLVQAPAYGHAFASLASRARPHVKQIDGQVNYSKAN